MAGMLEVMKYSVKFGSMQPADLWEVWLVCKGMRMVDGLGILRGVAEGDIDQDDCEGLSGPFWDWIASWLWSESRYDIRKCEAAEYAKGNWEAGIC